LLVTQVILIIFIAVVAVQLLFYFGIFSFFVFTGSTKKGTNKNIPTSVIIAAKNEAANLTECLPLYIKQKHSNFELILVNDNSSDQTLQVLLDFKSNNSDFKISIINLHSNPNGNKKNAITRAVKQAKFANLLFTDADCKPNSDKWIQLMTNKLDKKEIILGYGAYQKISNSLLNKLIRFETLITAIQYFSYAKIKIPYMGVGRNLAYKKHLFENNNGFFSHKHIKSGDDDLFINEVATKDNTDICFLKEAHTVSKPHINLKKWLHQKKRHISTAGNYKLKHQFLLALFYVSNFLFWILALFLLFYHSNTILVVQLFSLRLLVQYFYIFNASKKLDEKDLVIFTPVLELFLIIIQMYLFISSIFVKSKSW
jgi:glycosyltransferase involved in cell wall biosynthesis